jgi:hypothetical protein
MQLLEILDQAEAIQFDGTVTIAGIGEDYFSIDEDICSISEFYETDIDTIGINDYGNIEFEMDDDVYIISVLVRKELV